MSKTIFETNADKLKTLFPGFFSSPTRPCEYMKLENPGYEDLVIERIGPDEYSIAHYYTQNGDAMRDPEITFRAYNNMASVEVLTYQLDALGVYHKVYIEYDGKMLYIPKLKRELNSFFRQWLMNLKEQGFDRCKAV